MTQNSNRRLQVLHLIDHLGLGGAQNVLMQVLPLLQESCSVHLISLRKEHNAAVRFFPAAKEMDFGKWDLWGPVCFLKEYIKKNRIDIVHCHLQKSVYTGLLAVNLPYTRLVLHEHGNIVFGNRLYPFILRRLNKRADKIIAVSSVIMDILHHKANIPHVKLIRIPNSIDLSRFSGVTQTDKESLMGRLGITAKDYIIGYLGRFDKMKGVSDLLAMIKLIRDKIPEAKLLLVGSGPLEGQLKKLAIKYGIGDSVRFIGPQENIALYCSLFHVAAIPSRREPFGIVALEYGCMEIPMVATEADGLKELLADKVNALICPVGRPDLLAEKIIQLKHDPDLRGALIRRAKDLHTIYTREKTAAAILKLYGELYTDRTG
jgi:glycosyltransferase involved in cell wall biosynthesis